MVAWGCSADVTAPLPQDRGTLSLAQLESSCTNTDVGSQAFGNFWRHWPCGMDVSVGSTDPVKRSAVEAAIAAWETVLKWSAIPSVPGLYYSESSPSISVSWSGATGGLCGSTDQSHPPAYINIYGCGAYSPNTDAATVLTHEFTHVLGFADPGFEGADNTPHDCVAYIDKTTHRLNSTPCAQEVEVIYRGYGLSDYDPASIWTKSIVTRPNLASHALTVEASQNVAAAVTSISVDNPAAPNASVSASGATYQWESANTNRATVTGSGSSATITGVSPGTAYIRVKITGTSVATALVGTVARLRGDSIQVTVTPGPPPPPPGSGFRISDISGAPVPITQAGTYDVNATLVNPLNEFWQIRWDVTYNSPVHAPLHTSYVHSTMLALQAPAGSYRITVTATAQSEHLTTSHTTYFPVCTGGGGGGGDLLRALLPDSLAQTGSSAGAGTDAVGGC
jgi:hypothetical protein